MHQALLLLAIFLGFVSYSTATDPAWVAIFLDENSRTLCRNNFANTTLLENTNFQVLCDRSTIIFNPPSIDFWKPSFGSAEVLQALAYAYDTHNAAILVKAIGKVKSTNAFPHVTGVEGDEPLYATQYSNVLWERITLASSLQVIPDIDGKPGRVRLPNQQTAWQGPLNPFYSRDYPYPGGRPYPGTYGYLRILTDVIYMNGTCCVDSWWKEEKCRDPHPH